MTVCPSGKNVASNYGQRFKKHRTKVLGKAQPSNLLGCMAGRKGA